MRKIMLGAIGIVLCWGCVAGAGMFTVTTTPRVDSAVTFFTARAQRTRPGITEAQFFQRQAQSCLKPLVSQQETLLQAERTTQFRALSSADQQRVLNILQNPRSR